MSGNESRGISRRRFLKGTAAAGLGTAATAAGLTPGGVPTAAAEPLPPIPPHGAELRGMDLVVKSPTTEGRFGFMFKSQPPHPASDTLLDRLGATMEEQPPANPSQYLRPEGRKRRLQREPQPEPHLGVHLRRPVRRPRHHLRHHEAQRPAVRPRRHHELPHAALRPRRHLRAGPNLNPQFYDPNDRDKFLIRRATYSQITGKLKEPDGADETKTWAVKPDVV